MSEHEEPGWMRDLTKDVVWVVSTDFQTNALFHERERAAKAASDVHRDLYEHRRKRHPWNPVEHPGDHFQCSDCRVAYSQWLIR